MKLMFCGLYGRDLRAISADNILDKVFTNRPDCFTTTVVKSLLKTKHMSVLASNSNSLNQFKPKRKKV